MANTSSYLNYLPPALWENEPPPPAFSLGAMLRIFEKILSGLDDGEGIAHGDHSHAGIEQVIAQLHRLFDPWTTPGWPQPFTCPQCGCAYNWAQTNYTCPNCAAPAPPDFLAWLASWVGLEFSNLWGEYERRKITAQMAQVYRQRGLKAGLVQYLELYTTAATRPRLAIDDGSKLLLAQPQPGRLAPLTTLVSQGPSVRYDTGQGAWLKSHDGLVRPQCLALAPDGSLFIGDWGTPAGCPVDVQVKSAIWRITSPGQDEFTGSPPQQVPKFAPVQPRALAVDNLDPFRLYVLDEVTNDAQSALYRLTSPKFDPVVLATKGQLGIEKPVAMVFDNDHLLILDRGVPGQSPPKIIDVNVLVSSVPPPVSKHNLTEVVTPLSLAVLPNSDLIIGDGRYEDDFQPADLVRINRSNPLLPLWSESFLLTALPQDQNPLVAPTALVSTGSNRLFVLDAGLKPSKHDDFLRQVAEPAAVYAVELVPPAVTRITETHHLVYPTGMVFNQGMLYICDSAEQETSFASPGAWRAFPHQFGVIVHFSELHPTTVVERRKIVGNIREIVAREKPAHTRGSVLSPIK